MQKIIIQLRKLRNVDYLLANIVDQTELELEKSLIKVSRESGDIVGT